MPTAITAFKADDLEREKINSTQDLQGRVPSLTVSAFGQTRNTELPTIRGQGATFGSSPGVVIYMAEVPAQSHTITSGQGGPGKFFDLTNLQVLKGSQGTLFGRNTTGGALLLEPHKPDDRYVFSIKEDHSQFSGDTVENVINLPLLDNTLTMRLATQYVGRGGFTHDVATGEDYDNKHYLTSRFGLMWKPTDRIDNYFLASYTDSRDNGSGWVLGNINRPGLNYGILEEATSLLSLPNPTTQQQIASFQTLANTLNFGCLWMDINAPSTNCGQNLLAAQRSRGIRQVDFGHLNEMYDYVKTGSAIDQFKFDVTDQIALRNITSYSFLLHSYNWNLAGTYAGLNYTNNKHDQYSTNTGQFTEEMQLQGAALENRLKFATGVYYQSVLPIGMQEETTAGLFFVLPPYIYTVKQISYAPYAQGTYDLGGRLDALDGYNFTLGARYTTDNTTGSSNAGLGPHTASTGKSVPTWTVGLDKQVEDTLLYGKVSRGYKAGGFEVIAANPADYTFKPEYVTNFEVGQKSDFRIGDAPARLNTAAYYTNYSDMQRDATDSAGGKARFPPAIGESTFTAGKAEMAGLELEGTVRPLPILTLSANYALNYGKYRQYHLVNNELAAVPDCSGQLIPVNDGKNTSAAIEDLHCIPFASLPKHQASFTGIFTLPQEVAGGRITGSLTYAWTDRQYSSTYEVPQAEPTAWLSPSGLLNASLNWDRLFGEKHAAELRFYGTNLTNRVYRIANSNVWNTVFYQSSLYGEPRILGLQLSYGWGE
ncbi:MAG: TonB-dependent receptor plug domain-containing protein [Nevskia sp.]|nr:TonB-dependent receptor plug domain-containing protein [Nevskia sp.]